MGLRNFAGCRALMWESAIFSINCFLFPFVCYAFFCTRCNSPVFLCCTFGCTELNFSSWFKLRRLFLKKALNSPSLKLFIQLLCSYETPTDKLPSSPFLIFPSENISIPSLISISYPQLTEKGVINFLQYRQKVIQFRRFCTKLLVHYMLLQLSWHRTKYESQIFLLYCH